MRILEDQDKTQKASKDETQSTQSQCEGGVREFNSIWYTMITEYTLN